jgi:hypothetical protein
MLTYIALQNDQRTATGAMNYHKLQMRDVAARLDALLMPAEEPDQDE